MEPSEYRKFIEANWWTKQEDNSERLLDELMAKVLGGNMVPEPPKSKRCSYCDEPTEPGNPSMCCWACQYVIQLSDSQKDRIMAEPERIAEDWMWYLREEML